MKILFLIPELGYGGAETALLRLAVELGNRHSITLAVFSKTYQVAGYSTAPVEVPFPLIELDHDPVNSLGSRGLGLRRWQRRASALRRLKKENDITISFLSGANLLNAVVRSTKPCVLSERGSKRHDSSQPRLRRWIWSSLLDPWAYRQSQAIVTVSLGLKREVQQALPARLWSRVHAICGYCHSEHALAAGQGPIEPELLALERRPVLVAAGRLHHQKGFHVLLPLFARVAQQVSGSALLLIGDGPLEAALIEQAHNLGLHVVRPKVNEPIDPRAQVIMLGYRQNPARYTRLGRAFVLPSLYEGLPNLLLEALAAGAWCLAADCPWGPAEILTEPDLGQLLPPIQDRRNHLQWERALLGALERPKVMQLPFARRQQVIERFSIQRTAVTWEVLLKQLSDRATGVDECAA